MVEDVERLHRELERGVLRELRFFREREIDLPAIQGANHAIRSIAESSEVSVRIDWRGLKCRRIDQGTSC